MRRLHILFLSSWYPTQEQPFLGNFVKRHAELLAQDHKVTVLNLQSGDVSKIQIAESRHGNLTELQVKYTATRSPFMKWHYARKAFFEAVQHIRDIDLIHGNVILSKGLQFVWAKKHFNKPLIVSEHASYYREEIRQNWSLKEKTILRKVLKNADLLTAVSPFLADEIRQAFPSAEVKILPNVIDPELFCCMQKETREVVKFIHISTLDEKVKGVAGMIEACRLLKADVGANFNLQIVSDEPYASWQEKVQALDLDDVIHFSGPSQPEEIARELQNSDALILFSSYETFSIVLAEAWATGTPVISTPVGIAKSLDPKAGIEVKVNDPGSLKLAMQSFVEGKVSFDQHELLQFASAYTPGKVLRTIESLYAKLI